AGDTADIAAHRGGTGEGDEGRDRMLDKGITDFRTGAHHHTEYTGRQTGFLEDARQQQTAGYRGITGRFDDNRIAQCQRRGNRPGAQVQREVPGADDPDHAQRRAVHTTFLARYIGRQDAAVAATRQTGRLQSDCPGSAPLDLRLDPGTAGLADQPVDDLVLALIEDLH